MGNNTPARDGETHEKGALGGPCNRTACQRHGAFWFNRSTEKHYCDSCAEELNRVNATDAQRLYGGPLCVRVQGSNGQPARDGETLSDEQVTKILSKAKREAYHWGDELNTDRGARLRESLDKVATSHAALRAECTRLRAALGMNVEYRDLTGCEHAIHESCDKCVCPTCRTRAVQTKELGWMPVTAFPARAAAPTPGETTNG